MNEHESRIETQRKRLTDAIMRATDAARLIESVRDSKFGAHHAAYQAYVAAMDLVEMEIDALVAETQDAS